MFKQEPRPVNAAMNQYCAPLCYELTGKSYMLRFDDGIDLYVNFLDEKVLLLGQPGLSPTLECYCCMKSDDLTYFVHIDRSKVTYAPVTLVLDFENRLVTRIDSGKGSPVVLHWFTMKAFFGYIDIPGYAAPEGRHEITHDHVGSKIEWRYNDIDAVYHLYMPNDTVRLGWLPLEELSPRRQKLYIERKEKGLELFEEPVQFIKIKKDKYLACFCECNMAQIDPNQGGGGILLMDLAKITDVGIFHTFDKNNKESYSPVGAIGKLTTREFKEETMESRYKVRYGMDGRQVYP